MQFYIKTASVGDLPNSASSPFSLFYNNDWANRKLRFAIATLQGKYESTTVWKRPLQTALIVRDELLEHGYKWQAQRIDNWIHRLQPKNQEVSRPGIVLQANRPDLRERREEGSF
jgi:hypothetical protein